MVLTGDTPETVTWGGLVGGSSGWWRRMLLDTARGGAPGSICRVGSCPRAMTGVRAMRKGSHGPQAGMRALSKQSSRHQTDTREMTVPTSHPCP